MGCAYEKGITITIRSDPIESEIKIMKSTKQIIEKRNGETLDEEVVPGGKG